MLFQLLRYLLIAILLTLAGVIEGKDLKIQLKIHPSNSKVQLFEIYGSALKLKDSIYSRDSEVILKISEKDLYNGFYRLKFNDSLFYDFIAGCNESIKFEIDLNNFEKTFKISEDKDNELLLSFKKDWDQLIKLHQTLLQVPTEGLTEEMKINIETSIANYYIYKNDLIDSYSKKFECDIFKKLIKMNNSDYTNSISNYLTIYLPLKDSSCIHTTSFNQSIIDFYGKFGEFNQESFERLSDSLLFYTNGNKQNYNFTINYLYKLFSEIGPQSVFYYLIKNYYDPALPIDLSIKNKIDKYLKFQPGTNFKIEYIYNTKGEIFPSAKKLKKQKYHLLVWWDPECEHCLITLPELSTKNWNGIKIKVHTIAMTNDEQKWKATLESLKIGELDNYIDKNSWDSFNTKNLLIYKTPFFILLDKNGKFIAYDVDYPEILTFIK